MLDISGQGLRVRDGLKDSATGQESWLRGLCQFRWSLAGGSCFEVVLCGRAVIPGHSSPLDTQIMTTRLEPITHATDVKDGGSSSLPTY